MERKITIDVAGSSCVSSAEYFPATLTLRIGFVGGETYDYEPVPPRAAEALRLADSKGRFVNTAIKPHFRCHRLA